MQDVAEVGVNRVENGNKNTIGEMRTTGIKGTREEGQHDGKGDMTSGNKDDVQRRGVSSERLPLAMGYHESIHGYRIGNMKTRVCQVRDCDREPSQVSLMWRTPILSLTRRFKKLVLYVSTYM